MQKLEAEGTAGASCRVDQGSPLRGGRRSQLSSRGHTGLTAKEGEGRLHSNVSGKTRNSGSRREGKTLEGGSTAA